MPATRHLKPSQFSPIWLSQPSRPPTLIPVIVELFAPHNREVLRGSFGRWELERSMVLGARDRVIKGQLRQQALKAASTDLWGELDGSLQRRLAELAQVRRYLAGATIVAQEDLPPLVFWVVGGVAGLAGRAPDHQALIVGLKMPSEIFDYARARPLAFALEAATRVTMLTFDRPVFEDLAWNSPDFSLWLTERYLDELDATREWMLLLGQRSVKARFASFLIMLHRRLKVRPMQGAADEREPLEGQLQISRRDIALCLRSTKESVSRTIQSLICEGVVLSVKPKALILSDFERLVKISGDEILSAASEHL